MTRGRSMSSRKNDAYGIPKIAMRTHSARAGRAGDEAGATSPATAALARGWGAVGTGPCGPALVTAEFAVALRGCVFGSVAMSRIRFLSSIVLPKYFDRI